MEIPTNDEIKENIDLTANGQQTGNGFPVEVFPSDVREIIHALESKQGFPKDYTAASILFAVSVAAGNGFTINSPYFQKSVIYLSLVGAPGIGKTHPLAWALNPIENFDADNYQAFKEAKTEFERNDEQAEKPIRKQFLIKDYTPEAVAGVHEQNPHGLGVYKDELAGWFESFGRYNKNAEQQFWLSNWSLQPISTNRKTTADHYIKSPFISVAGTIQPALLEKMAGEFRNETGFIDRILFVYPENLEPQSWSENPDSEKERVYWDAILNSIIDHSKQGQFQENTTIDFSQEGYQVLKDWQHRLAKEIKEANRSGDNQKAQLLSKLDSQCLRLSIILAVLNSTIKNRSPQIDKEIANGAIKLTEYFKAQGLKIKESIGTPELNKKTVLQYLAGIGASQSLIAQVLGVNRSYVSNVLKGRK